MNNNLKVLYDASILNNFNISAASRTGIYWTAYNLLKYLSLKPEVDIYLYSDNYEKTKKFINKNC